MFVVSCGNKSDAILLFYFHTHFHSNSVQSSSGIYLMNRLISEASVLCLCRVPTCFLALVMTHTSQVEMPNPKLLSKGEDRSPLKYIINVLLSDSKYFIEKKFGLLIKVWVSFLEGPKFLSRGQTLVPKVPKSVAM